MSNVSPVDVACLCAAWCRLCEDYRAVLESLADEFDRTSVAVRWHWVDIEDEADLLGELDVETFPTIIVADADHVRFVGPVAPQRETLRRLLRAMVIDAAPSGPWPAVNRIVEAVAAGMHQRQPDRLTPSGGRSSKSE